MTKAPDMPTFDYIVVGGGTAGSVLAARLSAGPDVQVLLLEAGAARPTPEMADPLAWPRLGRTPVDWAYETVRQHATGAVHPWPRGKVLGGSSGINGLMHIRGDRSSYDAWAVEGWDYESLLPFLKRSERATGDPAYRGHSGPMTVAVPDATAPIWEACFEAAVQAGHPSNEDSNGAVATGTSWNENTVVDGQRQSAADAYLTPAAGRPNLTIVTDATVHRLVIERSRCRGVEYVGADGHRTVSAEREVILTAGVVGSPHLLLRSGVGPGQQLRELGIDVLADLPGVGANLQDHPLSEVSYAAPSPVRSAVFARKPHVLLRSTPTAAPDLQVIFIDAPVHPRWAPGREDGYSVIVSLMTPASRGSLRLASADPTRPPLIDPNYLGEDWDVDRMGTGLLAARDIGAAAALAPFRARELHPGPDADHTAYLRSSVSSYFHGVGTCRLGADAGSVVDPLLRVHGIANLRIADASVMPSIVSGNTNAAVLGIAERAADLVMDDGQRRVPE